MEIIGCYKLKTATAYQKLNSRTKMVCPSRAKHQSTMSTVDRFDSEMAHAVLFQGSMNQWNASYYDNANKRWIFGILHLLPTALFFEAKNIECKNEPDNPLELFIKFSVVSAIKKATSSLIYPSITVVTTGKVTHWFSSLGNRDSVYIVIEHVFHAYSLNVPSKDNRNGQKLLERKSSHNSSKFGRELLQNVHDSHETLSTAASKLTIQGHQISKASCTVDEMQEDLGVATRITNGIDSWFGRWKVPTLIEQESIHVVNTKDIPYGFHFDVLCCKIQGLTYGLPKECVLRLMQGGLTILDKKQKTLHHYGWRDISKLQIVTPWEVTVSQYLIGKSDISYTITCMEMPKVLKELEKFIPEKIESINCPSDMSSLTNNHGGQIYGKTTMAHSGMARETDSWSRIENRTSILNESVGDLGSQQMEEKGVTDDEMNQLSSTLRTLKSLALDVQREEDKQLKALDELTISVEKGNDKLGYINKKLKKLIR